MRSSTRQTFLNTRLDTIQRLRSNQRGPVRVLDELSRNLPEQAWLETIDEGGGVYKVAGYALTNFAVADLLRNLQRSREFAGVDLSLVGTGGHRHPGNQEIYYPVPTPAGLKKPDATPAATQRKPGA